MFSAAIGDEILGDKEGNNFLKRKLGMTKRMFNLQEECCNEGCDNEEVWEMRTDVNAAQVAPHPSPYCPNSVQ